MEKKFLYVLIGILLITAITMPIVVYYFTSQSLGTIEATEPLRIGILMPLTGGGSYIGPEMMHGTMSGFEDANSAGGVLGRNIEIYIEDDQSDPTQAVLAARKLIDVNHVKVIVGMFLSSQVLAVAPICIENHVILFGGGAADEISFLNDKTLHPAEDTGWVFRSCPTASQYAGSVVKTAVEKAGATRVGLMTENQPWGLSIAKYIKKLLEDANVTYKEIVYDSNKISYRSEMESMLSFNPNVTIHTGWEPDIMVTMRNAYELGYRGKWAINGFSISENFAANMGPLAEGLLIANELPWDTPALTVLSQRLHERWGFNFTRSTAYVLYDAAIVTCLAAQKAGTTTNATAIKDQLLPVSNTPGEIVESYDAGLKALKEGKDIVYKGVFVRNGYNEYGDPPVVYFGIYEIQSGQMVKVGGVEVPATYIK
jgi:branched-chain amino acid transport system substrate-binding protein